MDARRRWLNRVPFWGWRSMPSMVSSPGEARGVGKLERASRNGGILSSRSFPLPGLMDLMPTIMMGTILPSPSPSPSCASPAPPRLPDLVSPLLLPAGDPNLNILKKLSGAGLLPGASLPSSVVLPLCLRAEAILPFCRACRKLSKVPSSPSPATLRASETALWSSPMREAAVAAAATDSRRDSIAAWSSSLRMGERRRRSELVMLRRPLSGLNEGSMDDVLPSRLNGSGRGRGGAEGGSAVMPCMLLLLLRLLPLLLLLLLLVRLLLLMLLLLLPVSPLPMLLLLARSSKLRSSSGTRTRGRKGERS